MRRIFQMNEVPYRIPQPNNMGVVRYILAFAVFLAHFNLLAGTRYWFPISSGQAVGGFFALSGFLMAGSYLKRPEWKWFVLSRCRRILPAYWTVVILFALVGCFFSTDAGYFVSEQFWEYLTANIAFLNFLQPDLPGLFEHNMTPAVNGSLWTMKVEWMLYLSAPCGIWLLMRCRKHLLLTIGVIYLCSMLYRVLFFHLYRDTCLEIYNMLSRQFIAMLMYFYTGMMIYFYLNSFLRFKWWIMIGSVGLIIAFEGNSLFQITLEPLLISCLVLWLSMVGRWGTFEGKHDNISYNIYLSHWPVIQLMVQCGLPQRIGTTGTFLAACATIFIVSWLIGQFVEKPVQRRWHV